MERNGQGIQKVFMKRLKEIWRDTLKRHLRKWKQFPGLAEG